MSNDPNQLADRLTKAAALETEDAVLRFSTTYEPAAGPHAKVYPPSYATDRKGESVYATERRFLGGDEPIETVTISARQDSANRVEVAFGRALSAGFELPHLRLDFVLDDSGERIVRSITSLEAPHRSRDSYFRDAEIDGVAFDRTPVGEALAEATPETAAPFVEHAPLDIVLGTWDSHRGRRRPTRFPRIYASEIFGLEPQVGHGGGGRMDPFVLMKDDALNLSDWDLADKNQKAKMSAIGHGMVPATLNPSEYDERMAAGGGVSVREIRRAGMISFVGLDRVATGLGPTVDRPVRALLAGLALLGDRLAFGSPALSLRSGCDLVQLADSVEWVQRGGATEALDIDRDAARATFDVLLSRARAVGIRWSPDPVVMTPKPALQAALEQALTTVDVTADQD